MTGLTLLASGKVRELYELGDDLLMVASDRISTYDVVHPTPIPDKGKVLTALSVLWFDLTRDIVPNHLLSTTKGNASSYCLTATGSRNKAAEESFQWLEGPSDSTSPRSSRVLSLKCEQPTEI